MQWSNAPLHIRSRKPYVGAALVLVICCQMSLRASRLPSVLRSATNTTPYEDDVPTYVALANWRVVHARRRRGGPRKRSRRRRHGSMRITCQPSPPAVSERASRLEPTTTSLCQRHFLCIHWISVITNGFVLWLQEYQVLNLLGKGGFASVYRAKCLRTSMEVAIKMVSWWRC